MPSICYYQPNAISLPEHFGLIRDYAHARPHHDRVEALDEQDWARHDKFSLLYDVFFHSTRPDCLLAIGPPRVNLKKALWPMRVWARRPGGVREHRLRVLSWPLQRCRLYRFLLPRALEGQNSLDLRLDFNGRLQYELSVSYTPTPRYTLQLSTLQKDNPVSWIADWMRYHEALGVERIVIYDNGSTHYAEPLHQILANIPSNLQLVIVDWPFPYGPVNSFYNHYAHAAQINHAFLAFGQCDWMGNCDVDEYFLSSPDLALLAMLKAQPRRTGLLRHDSYLLWTDRHFEQQPSARDLTVREVALRGKAHKYFARPEALLNARTHNGILKPGYRRVMASPEHAFLHFMRLSVNWRGDDIRHQPIEFNDRHVSDTRVADVLNRLDRSPVTPE